METIKSFKMLRSIVISVAVDATEITDKPQEFGPWNCACCRKEKRDNKGRNLGKKPVYKNVDRTSINPNKALS